MALSFQSPRKGPKDVGVQAVQPIGSLLWASRCLSFKNPRDEAIRHPSPAVGQIAAQPPLGLAACSENSNR